METIKPPRMTIFFIGHDGYFYWTEMAISHFKDLSFPKIHLSHTKPVNQEGVVDVLAPHFLIKPEVLGDIYHRAGRDMWVDRMIEGISPVTTKYVWLVQSDHLYINLPSQDVIDNDFLDSMDTHRLDQLKLYADSLGSTSNGPNRDKRQTLYQRDDLEIKYSGGDSYPISHHATIFRTEWFLDSLREVKAAGLNSAHDHELYFYEGGGGPANGQLKCKYTEEDDLPWRIAEASGTGVKLLSTLATGKLRLEAIEYLTHHCTHPNRLLYEGKEVGYDILSGNNGL